MASVRLTQDLQSRILRKTANAFSKPLEEAQNTLSPTFGDRCYEYVLRKQLKAMAMLPENYFEQETRQSFDIINFNGKQEHMYLDFTTAKAIPQCYTNYRNSMKVKQSSLYDEYIVMQEKTIAIRKEQNTVEKLIRSGFNNATTLKKLLEMIPEIEMFIPEDALRTHYEKVAPKQRQVIERTKVTANDDQKVAMAKLKMMGAITGES